MKRDILRQFAVIFTTLYALIFNGAANAIPLNGRSTGVISDSFNVLFVPAGYVFAIWGIIYIGMLAYTIFQALPSQRTNPRLRSTGWLMALSGLANGSWIYFWHFGYYTISLATMLVLLGSLTAIYLRLGIGKTHFNPTEKWTISIPISIYLGWITVATLANATAVLSTTGWNGWGINPEAWTVILLAAGVTIGAAMAFTRSDVAYLLVLVWAFSGISARWTTLPVIYAAGLVSTGLVVIFLVASRIRLSRMATASL
jgi:benzodiazapine receptor